MTINVDGFGTITKENTTSELFGNGIHGDVLFLGYCQTIFEPISANYLYLAGSSLTGTGGNNYISLSATKYLGIFDYTYLSNYGLDGYTGTYGGDGGYGGGYNAPGAGGMPGGPGGNGGINGNGQAGSNGLIVKQNAHSQHVELNLDGIYDGYPDPENDGYYQGYYYQDGMMQYADFPAGGNGGAGGAGVGGYGGYADIGGTKALPWLQMLAKSEALANPIAFGGGGGGGGAGDATHTAGGGGAGGSGGGAIVLRAPTVAIDMDNCGIDVRGGGGGNGANGDNNGETGGGGGGGGGDGGIILIVAEQIEVWYDGEISGQPVDNIYDLFDNDDFYYNFENVFNWSGGTRGGGGGGYNGGANGAPGYYGHDGQVYWYKPSTGEVWDLVYTWNYW